MPEGWPWVPGAPGAALGASGLPLTPKTQGSPCGGTFRPAHGEHLPVKWPRPRLRVKQLHRWNFKEMRLFFGTTQKWMCLKLLALPLLPFALACRVHEPPPASTPACSSALCPQDSKACSGPRGLASLGFGSSDGQPLGSAHTLLL